MDLMKHQGVDTSILLHLIGQDGAGELEFKQLCTFMNNLQTEVILIEFAEFSKAKGVTELDFARISTFLTLSSRPSPSRG